MSLWREFQEVVKIFQVLYHGEFTNCIVSDIWNCFHTVPRFCIWNESDDLQTSILDECQKQGFKKPSLAFWYDAHKSIVVHYWIHKYIPMNIHAPAGIVPNGQYELFWQILLNTLQGNCKTTITDCLGRFSQGHRHSFDAMSLRRISIVAKGQRCLFEAFPSIFSNQKFLI